MDSLPRQHPAGKDEVPVEKIVRYRSKPRPLSFEGPWPTNPDEIPVESIPGPNQHCHPTDSCGYRKFSLTFIRVMTTSRSGRFVSVENPL